MKILRLVFIISSIILGSLGYLETIFPFQWCKEAAWICLVIFILLSIGQVILDKIKEAKEAEDFYSQEIVEIFPHEDSQEKLKFFTDESGNKCVAINLEQEPIPKSLKLWEGGYDAPPITLAFDSANKKRVIFKNSAYSSFEDYFQKQELVYQVRYFPKK